MTYKNVFIESDFIRFLRNDIFVHSSFFIWSRDIRICNAPKKKLGTNRKALPKFSTIRNLTKNPWKWKTELFRKFIAKLATYH